jgi:hypothetical protein
MPESSWGHMFAPDGRPLPKNPATDFLRKVEVWQQPGTGSVPVSMPGRDSKTLRQLLKEFRYDGPSAQLETQARNWLIGYRELSPMLNEEQSAQLDVAIDGLPKPAAHQIKITMPEHTDDSSRRWANWALAFCAACAVVLLAVMGVGVWRTANPPNPVQQGSQSQAHPAPQQVPAGTTALENLETDWGPWKNLPASQQDPQTGAPAVLLLNQGGYYASEKWTVLPGRDWTADLSGSVSGVDVQGGHALIEDADGNPYVVGILQPFVFASNPGTILMIDPAGDVLAVPEAHAIALRMRL